ncbi:J domain-containing protein [Pontibacter cellulosilyticus]|uniref:J domain-containing protein n=1 Tax=Pontibacter cellulosilyticus TaxID=1720253 RepID=A0A923N5R8_9BACT|nr:J domain-containing protein [Pontibacter cellulosilyticus]MBC5992736.1 J domain-containing protein [Pontibacter cellulosilyticus]
MPQSNKPARQLTPQITSSDKRKLSKLQEEFNQKTALIDQLKQELAAKHESINLAQKRIEKELRPIIDQQLEKRVELAQLLDEAFALPLFSFREKEKLAALIENITFDLIANYERRDMVELHDRYAEFTYKEKTVYDQEDEQNLDESIADDEPETEDAFGDLDEYERIQAQLDREMERREREKQNRQKSRKTKAQLAKEAQAKAELSNISKASRRVYTELAKQLHPDKERDETMRAWKEEAMKRVTQAYHHDDFFELLRLQMEFMQEQGQALDMMPDEQLQYYVQILADQVDELKAELQEFSSGPNSIFYTRFCGTSKQMDQKFKSAKENLTQELEQLKQNLRTLQTDPQMIRVLLK